jgi:glycosyltransferase involved in cell wall biosynthesis
MIVVDDGSTDDGPEKVLAFNDPKIVLIKQENRGPGAARNAGLAIARGKYVSFLDADDEWLPSFLEAGLALLEDETAKVNIIWTGYYRHPSMRKNNAGMEELSGVYEISAEDSITVIQKIVSFISACTAIMRTDVARKWGGFFEQYKCLMGEDRYLFLKILFNERIGIIPEPHGIYHCESSDLCYSKSNTCYPPAPYLLDPAKTLEACPSLKQGRLKELLVILAAEKAKSLSTFGRGRDAKDLLKRFHNNNYPLPKGIALSTHLFIKLSPVFPFVRQIWRYLKMVKKQKQLGYKKFLKEG